MSDKNLKRTSLHAEHVRLGARMVPFAGYEMPVQYTGVLEETKAVRTNIGLFDVSHMGQIRLRGNAPREALQKLVTNDLTKLQEGQAQYNLLCNPKGGVIDDIIVYDRGPKELFICVNASNRDADREWLLEHLPSSVSLTDESDETSLIAIQGPKAEALVSSLGDASLIRDLKYYWAVDTEIAGIPVYLSRTGYTGEDGYEIYLPNSAAPQMWNTLLEKGEKFGTRPIGLGARDTLRLEMGYPLHGHELSTEISPISAGLSWVVKLNKPEFIGKASLEAEAQKGAARVLAAFRIFDRRIARQEYKIFSSDKKATGVVTSGTQSPHLNCPIAMGFIGAEHKADTDFFVEIRNELLPAQKVALPFVPSRVKKNVR